MPKISLWKEHKDRDYYFSDHHIGEIFNHGGTGVLVHKYLGPQGENTNEMTIQDVLLLENRSRKYSDDVLEVRGTYKPQDSDFDLSQFGIFLTNDTIFISFHYSTMIEMVGRKLMSGDVLELPHLRDSDLLDETKKAINRFYVIDDAMHSAEGYGVSWHSHIWRVKCKIIKDSPEYSDILGHGSQGVLVDENGDVIGPAGSSDDLKDSMSTYNTELAITDANVAEAETYVKFDPKWVDSSHLWVEELETGEFNYYMWSGDGIPPNGKPLAGSGTAFPLNLVDGDFFLRTDYTPDRLFRKQGNIFKKIEDDMRRKWTACNTVLDGFIDNKDTSTLEDGTVIKQKQALSKVIKPKVNHHVDKQNEIKGNP